MLQKRRVVVTGLGALSSLGSKLDAFWENIIQGKSGVNLIDASQAQNLSSKIAATVQPFENTAVSQKDAKKMDLFIQYGLYAASQAINDSGLDFKHNREYAEKTGVMLGSGIGGIDTLEKNVLISERKGANRISPFFIPATIINMLSGHVSIMYGLKGPNLALATACSTGSHSIGCAARMIAYGDADIMIAGGAEFASTKVGMGGFAAMRALSTRNDEPQAASRPFDKDRDGFVLGDGAGVLVLEEYEQAKRRGATIYAECLGFGYTADAHHMTLPSGDGAKRAIEHAMQDAKINADEVNYVNAHATSTLAGDIVEANVIHEIFYQQNKDLAISSTKSMIGHMLGAAGAIESIIAIKALNTNIVPPTINLDNLDKNLPPLNYIANVAQEKEINTVVNNSFGFGGTNASLIFSAV